MLNKLRSFFKNAHVIVVIGMGNELRADDAVGLHVVRLLKPFTNNRLFVFEGHMMPEAFISPACASHPTHLLIIDAAELHQKPGSWQILSLETVDSGLFTTHSIPATEVAAEIQRRCGTKVAFVGIQPKNREVSLSMSQECVKTAEEIAETIKQIIHVPPNLS